MTRIAVIGNCQALSIAESIRLMAPNAFVNHIYSWEASKWYSSFEEFLRDLRTYDFIFCHDVPINDFPIANFEQLKEHLPKAILFPVIVFPAYHPDLVYVTLQNSSAGPFLVSPIGPYNSAIGHMAYKLGFTAREASRLFDEEVYEKLGYFDMWQASQDALLKSGRDVDLPLEDVFAKWTRSGCFMHSINHPKISALFDVARLLLIKTDVRIHTINWKPYLADASLIDAVWPVYPPVAERLGIEGSYIFRRPDYASKDKSKFLLLENYIEECFAAYRFYSNSQTSCERVDNWLEDYDLRQFIKEKAMKKG